MNISDDVVDGVINPFLSLPQLKNISRITRSEEPYIRAIQERLPRSNIDEQISFALSTLRPDVIQDVISQIGEDITNAKLIRSLFSSEPREGQIAYVLQRMKPSAFAAALILAYKNTNERPDLLSLALKSNAFYYYLVYDIILSEMRGTTSPMMRTIQFTSSMIPNGKELFQQLLGRLSNDNFLFYDTIVNIRGDPRSFNVINPSGIKVSRLAIPSILQRIPQMYRTGMNLTL